MRIMSNVDGKVLWLTGVNAVPTRKPHEPHEFPLAHDYQTNSAICYHCDGTGVSLRMTPGGADSPTCATCGGTGNGTKERIKQCDLCCGEPIYGFNIPVNLLDGGIEEQWRQVCDSCAASILRSVASGLR